MVPVDDVRVGAARVGGVRVGSAGSDGDLYARASTRHANTCQLLAHACQRGGSRSLRSHRVDEAAVRAAASTARAARWRRPEGMRVRDTSARRQRMLARRECSGSIPRRSHHAAILKRWLPDASSHSSPPAASCQLPAEQQQPSSEPGRQRASRQQPTASSQQATQIRRRGSAARAERVTAAREAGRERPSGRARAHALVDGWRRWCGALLSQRCRCCRCCGYCRRRRRRRCHRCHRRRGCRCSRCRCCCRCVNEERSEDPDRQVSVGVTRAAAGRRVCNESRRTRGRHAVRLAHPERHRNLRPQ